MWWRFYIFMKTFVLWKSSLGKFPTREIFLPQLPVWCFQLIFIIQYAVRKNIFGCLFSVYDTRSLSSHEQVRSIRLWSCERNTTPSAKRLSQTPFFRFWLRASLVIESFLRKLKTITLCFEHDIFHNNLKDNVYGQVYSYKYCRLLPK